MINNLAIKVFRSGNGKVVLYGESYSYTKKKASVSVTKERIFKC